VRRGDDPLLAISPEEYVRRLLGVDVPRDRKVRCPFHEDRHASLHVYETAERGWYCFGACRRGGTIYDLAAPLYGYTRWRVRSHGRERGRRHDQPPALQAARADRRHAPRRRARRVRRAANGDRTPTIVGEPAACTRCGLVYQADDLLLGRCEACDDLES